MWLWSFGFEESLALGGLCLCLGPLGLELQVETAPHCPKTIET